MNINDRYRAARPLTDPPIREIMAANNLKLKFVDASPPATPAADCNIQPTLPAPPAVQSAKVGDPGSPAPMSPAPMSPVQLLTAIPAAVTTPAEAASLCLTDPQRIAIAELTRGTTRSAAAIAAGVTRTTLYRWLNHDPAFQVAYNAWQRDLTATAQAQLLSATQLAVSIVLTAIAKGDARLAWKLLESQGLTRNVKPGPTDLALLQRKHQIDQKREEVDRRKELNDLLHDDMRTPTPYSSPL